MEEDTNQHLHNHLSLDADAIADICRLIDEADRRSEARLRVVELLHAAFAAVVAVDGLRQVEVFGYSTSRSARALAVHDLGVLEALNPAWRPEKLLDNVLKQDADLAVAFAGITLQASAATSKPAANTTTTPSTYSPASS